MNSLGIDYDFSESVNTSHPDYYKWTQWLFARFFENDFVYRKTEMVNWCNSCKTVLANEQVENGACERCKNEVVMKEVPGWFFKITDLSDELIEGLEKLDWPEHTKKNQINWIGKSEGAEISFVLTANSSKLTTVKVFTTRPDTLFGATYIVLAPEHPLVKKWTSDVHILENADEVNAYVIATKQKTEMERTVEEKEKTGVRLKGITAINPATKEEIPIFIADYVLGSYGTGAIMAVPAHDERDFAFAKKYDLPIKQVIAPHVIDQNNPPREGKKRAPRTVVQAVVKHWEKNEVVQIQWKQGLGWKTFVIGGAEENETPEEAIRREVEEETGYTNIKSVKRLSYEMRSEWFAEHKDENRYAHMNMFLVELGGPEKNEISKEEKEKHDVVWVPMESIPADFRPVSELDYIWGALCENCAYTEAYTGSGILINSYNFNEMVSEEAKQKITEFVGGTMTSTYRLRDWSISRQRYWGAPIPVVYDPEGNPHTVPDEHLPWLLPEDVDFIPTGESPLAKSKELHERTEKIFGKGWKPEVDTLDTFVCSSWYYLRYPDPHNEKEFCGEKRLKHWLPVDLYVGGSEHTYLHLLYARFFTKSLNKLGYIHFDEPFLKLRHQGFVLDANGVKMSKSKGNIVTPDDMVSRFGADAVRLYMMFAAPLSDDVLWDENGIVGTYRFLEKAIVLQKYIGEDTERTEKEIHKLIKKVGEDIEVQKFNTAISAMMIFVNVVSGEKVISKKTFGNFVRVLAPFAPHIAEELWEGLGNDSSVHTTPWPKYDESKIVEDTVTIAVQVNGKVRAEMSVSSDASQENIESEAKEKIEKWLNGEVERVIFVQNRLINFVTL
ncbi:leucine--tRNA ligase [Candidatus Kaiserbacteria bacterium CG10_big_fil_rev_8_21_14_0_10_43_70]|uniref:leucine--tRNA ligase n=1 Tax=Candidatus Kaiserbacteria bacterium CG10_big_fil_rev_8_21_14_0_10_43_70 TaxID=1974605 RepID=A0A2H0UIW9_9BACT|nr:MAG: leucine--tRNA ligase [Candidatus Kaiserbacteria bacterium CG10_big_fil_rev_8_21_14_0_10_43_70]